MSGVSESIISRLLHMDGVRELFLSYLNPRELVTIEATSRAWREAALFFWRAQAIAQGIELPTDSAFYFRNIKSLCQGGVFGLQFYRDYFGGNAHPIVPIPKSYIEASHNSVVVPGYIVMLWGETVQAYNQREKVSGNFQLTFLPEFIKITVDANSLLSLDENGNLVEDMAAVGAEREIDIPVTLNNMAILTLEHLKQGNPTEFHPWNRKSVLAQHGNTRIQSHWFYPRKEAVGYGLTYEEQQVSATAAGLEITPLIDTAIYHLFSRVVPRPSLLSLPARTSAHIVVPGAEGHGTITWGSPDAWEDHSIDRLSLIVPRDDNREVGAAVGIPARS